MLQGIEINIKIIKATNLKHIFLTWMEMAAATRSEPSNSKIKNYWMWGHTFEA